MVDPLVGKTVKGVYRVEELIGRGGMGRVYRATQLALDLPVAIKVLNRELTEDPSLGQRFEREARTLSRLRHANVISVTDFGQTEDGSPFMVMELVAGRSLEHVIGAEAPFPEARAVRIAAQVLAALAEAHAGGILHRDLKPANVMLEARRDEPDFVKVIDFGIAKIQAPDDGKGTLTLEGMICGTPAYMSPEQWNGEELDPRTDLYAMGVMLYEMLAGRKPYEASTPMALMRQLLSERLVPPSLWRPGGGGVSPGLEALVLQALSFKRGDRPESAEAMRAALAACAGVVAGEPAPAAPRAPPELVNGAVAPERAPDLAPTAVRRPLRRKPRTALAAAAAALGAAALGAAVFFRQAWAPLAPARTTSEPSVEVIPAPEPTGPGSMLADADADAAEASDAAQPSNVAEASEAAAAGDAESKKDAAVAVAPPASAASALPSKRPKDAPRRGGVIAVRDSLRSLATPPAASGEGILSIEAEPYGDVFLNGRLYGVTPRELRVIAGTYQVRVVHAKFGEQVKALEVRPGERSNWTADFSKR